MFTNFNNRLPDPTFTVSEAGAAAVTGSRGPGFASVRIRSNRPTAVSRTNSGRGVHRDIIAQYWEIDINYNPMFKSDFDVVSSFLDFRNARLNPFFVVLPQHSRPADPIFASFAESNVIKPSSALSEGVSSMIIQSTSNITGSPKFGDFFNIYDPNDINHQKTYKITAVETNSNYQSGTIQPAIGTYRIHFMPPLVKQVSSAANIVLIDPKFRVIQKSDVQEYDLNNNNLYQFQLSLEEILA